MNSYRFFKGAIILQILYAFLPIIRVSPDFVRTGWRVLPFALVTFAVISLNDRKLWKVFIGVFSFAMFLGFLRSMVYSNAIVESIPMNLAHSLLYWFTVVEGYYVLNYLNADRCRRLLCLTATLISFSCFTCIIGSILFPGAIRSSADFSETDFQYYIYNMGAYGYIYAILFFIPILLFYIKNKSCFLFKHNNMMKLYLLLGCIISTIFLSQFFTAISLAIIGLLGFFILQNNFLRFQKKLVKYSIFCVAFLFFSSPIVGVLAKIFSSNDFSALAERLYGVYQVLNDGFSAATNDVGARIFLYSLGIRHFFSNPLFGLWGELGFQRASYNNTRELLEMNVSMSVGQHSDILDLIGGSGLFGFIPFAWFLFWFWRQNKTKANTEYSKGTAFISMIMYIIYGIFDGSFACFDVALSVFVLVPMVCKVVKRPHRYIINNLRQYY